MSLYYLQLCWNHIARIYNFTLYSYPWEQFSEQSGLCGLDRIWIFWTVDISYLVDSPNKFLRTVDFSISPSIHQTSQYGLHSEQLRQSWPIPHRIMQLFQKEQKQSSDATSSSRRTNTNRYRAHQLGNERIIPTWVIRFWWSTFTFFSVTWILVEHGSDFTIL